MKDCQSVGEDTVMHTFHQEPITRIYKELLQTNK